MSDTAARCSAHGCERPLLDKKRMLCSMHYQRIRRNGTLSARKSYSSAEEAFAARTKQSGDCIVWTGTKTNKGYGTITDSQSRVYVHRYSWERENGPIPDGLHVDHLCHNRACVKISHLRLATPEQNQQNRSGAQANSTTGIRGVYWCKRRGKWRVQVQSKGKQHSGGYYEHEADAVDSAVKLRARLMPYAQN